MHRIDLLQEVYEQYLHANLEEIECVTLPCSLELCTGTGGGTRGTGGGGTRCGTSSAGGAGGAPVVYVDGVFSLQVLWALDVAKSNYSQLQRVQGMDEQAQMDVHAPVKLHGDAEPDEFDDLDERPPPHAGSLHALHTTHHSPIVSSSLPSSFHFLFLNLRHTFTRSGSLREQGSAH